MAASRVPLLLRLVTAAGLGVDAYVHATDAHIYAPVGAGLVTQGRLFVAEAVAAGACALAVLVVRHRLPWLAAFLVAAGGLAAVLLYRYVDVGALGPVPDMYEPTWSAPGKVLSAVAEGVAALAALAGLAALRRPRPRPAGS